MNIAGLAIDRRAKPVTWASRAAGHYDTNGEAVAGTVATFTIAAVVQPVGKDLRDVPEGLREEAKYTFWSRTFVKNNDEITWVRGTCRVIWTWERDEGGFCRALLGKVLP